MKKIIVRLFAACALFFLLVAAGIGTLTWLLFQNPTGYAEVREQQFTQSERDVIETRLNETTSEIEDWVKQQLHDPNAIDSATLTRTFMLSQDELNALLSDSRYSVGDLTNVRTIFNDDKIRIAGEIELSEDSSIVASLDFRITKTDNSRLKLEILAGSIGQVPIPVAWLLNSIPEHALPEDDKVEFRFSDATPHLLVDVVNTGSTPALKSIQTFDKKIKMDFGIPVVAH